MGGSKVLSQDTAASATRIVQMIEQRFEFKRVMAHNPP